MSNEKMIDVDIDGTNYTFPESKMNDRNEMNINGNTFYYPQWYNVPYDFFENCFDANIDGLKKYIDKNPEYINAQKTTISIDNNNSIPKKSDQFKFNNLDEGNSCLHICSITNSMGAPGTGESYGDTEMLKYLLSQPNINVNIDFGQGPPVARILSLINDNIDEEGNENIVEHVELLLSHKNHNIDNEDIWFSLWENYDIENEEMWNEIANLLFKYGWKIWNKQRNFLLPKIEEFKNDYNLNNLTILDNLYNKWIEKELMSKRKKLILGDMDDIDDDLKEIISNKIQTLKKRKTKRKPKRKDNKKPKKKTNKKSKKKHLKNK